MRQSIAAVELRRLRPLILVGGFWPERWRLGPHFFHGKRNSDLGGDGRHLAAAWTFDLLVSKVFLYRELLLARRTGERDHGGSSRGRVALAHRRTGTREMEESVLHARPG